MGLSLLLHTKNSKIYKDILSNLLSRAYSKDENKSVRQRRTSGVSQKTQPAFNIPSTNNMSARARSRAAHGGTNAATQQAEGNFDSPAMNNSPPNACPRGTMLIDKFSFARIKFMCLEKCVLIHQLYIIVTV